MDSTKKYDNPSPEEEANFINRLFFCWVLPLLKIGYENDLQGKDLYNAVQQDLSGPLGDDLERNWNKEVLDAEKTKGKRPSLKRAIYRTYFKSYMFYGLITAFNTFFVKLIQPIALGNFIRYFDKSSTHEPLYGWLMGTSVLALSFANVLLYHYAYVNSARIGMRVRIACSSLIYRKLLKLNHLSLGKTAAGQLVNFLSNDVVRFDVAIPFLHYIWIMPLAALGGLYVMYSYIGLAAIPTMAVMTAQAIFGQGYLSKLQGKYRGKIAKLTDQRVKLMNEITSGIQVIKMYAWERPFEKIVEMARGKEVDMVTRTSYIKGFSAALNVFVERATLYIAVISYVLFGNRITGEVVFSMAQLLNTIQLYMSIFFPMAYSSYEEAKVSIRRIEEFLVMEENDSLKYKDDDEQIKDTGIRIVKGRASWLPNPITNTLTDLNLEIKSGALCCVVGSVGSGKSSLLQVILRELPLNMGKLDSSTRISYASQEPWVFSSNVRKNILFGMPHIKERYNDVVRVSALQRDFEELPFGDKTQVGERGAALSGGQRARVALARAVYRDADIYLLDDPLSAVDAHVAKHLFEQCVQDYLRNKTRVLVTHQVQFLKSADLIVVMNNGKIEKMGTFGELENDLSVLSKEVEQQHQKHEEAVEKQEKQRERLQSLCSVQSIGEPEETEELLEKGAITSSTYVQYYKAGASMCVLVCLVLLLIIAQAMCNASDMWVNYWTNKEEERYLQNQRVNSSTAPVLDSNFSSIMDDTTTLSADYNETFVSSTMATLVEEVQLLSRDTYIMIYTGLILAAVILTSIRSTAFYKICMNASKRLHNIMFANILKAPMAFFDTNPSGRILNRFSKDMGAIDEILPKCILDTIQIFLVMAGILGMVFIINWWMIIPTIVLGCLFIQARQIYLSSAQAIKRLEGATKAPVFSHVSASLYGINSIRAFKAQDLIIREFDTLQDQHTSTWYLFLFTSEAMGFYLDVISTVFLALVTYQFMIFENSASGNVGLVIAHSLILTGMLQFGVRQSAEVSSNMTSVERVLQYTKLDEEGPWDPLPADKPPLDWPQRGHVSFKHAYLTYSSEAPPSIKNLNLDFQPGEKVGIVGRTGAGKSSLVATLFRLANIDGKVEIDALDTGKVGLKNLRSNISIIPQVPTLFSASLRYNLDPFERCSDEQLWQALERVELKQNGVSLDTIVSEGGANFSAGQRQLICLARAIVRNNKVLVMDEATANVDQHTDSLIQKTIREAFADCTVITIAHRLNTIIDCDKVLVMDHGSAVEFAHPHELLEKGGHFAEMVQQTGALMESKLRRAAQEAYEKKGS